MEANLKTCLVLEMWETCREQGVGVTYGFRNSLANWFLADPCWALQTLIGRRRGLISSLWMEQAVLATGITMKENAIQARRIQYNTFQSGLIQFNPECRVSKNWLHLAKKQGFSIAVRFVQWIWRLHRLHRTISSWMVNARKPDSMTCASVKNKHSLRTCSWQLQGFFY